MKNFTGISFREKGTITLAKKHLGIKSVFVFAPTLLIDKNHYLKGIKNYKSNFNINNKYIFVYQLYNNNMLKKIIKDSCEKLNYKVYTLQLEQNNYI